MPTRKLYLAKVVLKRRYYMGPSDDYEVIRVVWADSEDAAEDLLRKELEISDPYGYSVSIESTDISVAIGDASVG